MQWWYRIIQQTAEGYLYAYSHESKDLDGVISYSQVTEKATMEKVSVSDGESDWAQKRSVGHFYAQVVDEGFPEERHVCCG